MRRVLLLVGLICHGCGPQQRLEPCSPSGTGQPSLPVLVTLVGQSVDVELRLPPAVFCPQGNPVATDVVTQVLDASNQPVPHTHSPPTSSNTAGYSTRVTFTPTAAGVHYLTARFDPALGITQRQLQVALERTAETPWLRSTLGALCDEVLPLRDAVLCRRGTQLTVVRDGGATSTRRSPPSRRPARRRGCGPTRASRAWWTPTVVSSASTTRWPRRPARSW